MRFPPSGIHCPQCKFLIMPSPESGVVANRREKRMATYEKFGKRCADCHGYKDPATAFHRCAANGDGLQNSCKACIGLQYSLRKLDNARSVWLTTRDSLRTQNDAANLAAGRP